MKSRKYATHAKKKFCANENEKKYQKVRDLCHYTQKFRAAAHSICNLRYKVLKEIPVVIYNGSTHDYHFIIKQLAEEFESHFKYLGEKQKNISLFQYQLKKTW